MEVSVIVVCYNEEDNIGQCLNSLAAQDYPLEKYEINVADGGSRDQTQNIIRDFMQKHPNIKLVIEDKSGTASGRNAGIKASRFNHIAFIDADCQAPPDWLSLLAVNYRRVKEEFTDVIAVGGRNVIPQEAGNFQKAIGIALDSYIGSFDSIQGRQFKEPVLVNSLSTANSLYEKDKIVEIGYFDESLKSEAEDADLNFRLFSSGNKFMFIPDSFVWHKMRTTPKKWMNNMFRYGKGRARLLKRYSKMWNLNFLLPLFFIFGIALALLGHLSVFFYLPLLYLPLLFCFSFFRCLRKKTSGLTWQVMFVYLIQHFAYALGEIYGLLNPKVK